MTMLYRIVGYDVQGDEIVRDFDTEMDTYPLIGEMIKDSAHWKLITFEEFDGLDRVYDATIWKNPIWMRDIDL